MKKFICIIAKINNKGYTTLEAAIIIPMTLIITMLLIWLGIFFFDKNVMAHVAGRVAIMAGQHPEKSNDELVTYAITKAGELLDGNLICMDEPSIEVTVSYSEIVVHMTGSLNLPGSTSMGGVYSKKAWEIDLTEKGAKMNPSLFVRTVGRVRNGLSENKVTP